MRILGFIRMAPEATVVRMDACARLLHGQSHPIIRRAADEEIAACGAR